jgi:hypothetical protein
VSPLVVLAIAIWHHTEIAVGILACFSPPRWIDPQVLQPNVTTRQLAVIQTPATDLKARAQDDTTMSDILVELAATGDLKRIERTQVLRSERRSAMCIRLARQRYRNALDGRTKRLAVWANAIGAAARFDQNQEECCVCMDGPANTRFRPCDHVATCTACASQLPTCPLCRASVTDRLEEQKPTVPSFATIRVVRATKQNKNKKNKNKKKGKKKR